MNIVLTQSVHSKFDAKMASLSGVCYLTFENPFVIAGAKGKKDGHIPLTHFAARPCKQTALLPMG